MAFSKEWELLYQKGLHDSKWPWSDVIALVMNLFQDLERPLLVLELGCGVGANIPFFKAIGASYFAIDGSETSVNGLHRRFPDLEKNIVKGDFTENIHFNGPFDLILDRAALTHNPTSAIRKVLGEVMNILDSDGYFIGVDWFSNKFSEFNSGVPVEDNFTRGGFQDGKLANTGIVHFSDEKHLRNLFNNFEIILLEHKIVQQLVPDNNWRYASWNIVATLKK